MGSRIQISESGEADMDRLTRETVQQSEFVLSTSLVSFVELTKNTPLSTVTIIFFSEIVTRCQCQSHPPDPRK